MSQDVFKKLSYKVEDGQKGFLSALLNCAPPVLDEHFPLHDYKEIRKLDGMLKKSSIPLKGIDINAVRNYFGACGVTNILGQHHIYTRSTPYIY